MITMTNDKWSWWPHTWSRVWTDLDRPRQWLVLVAIMITSIADIIIMMPIAIHDHQDHYKSSNPDILFDIITSKWLVKKLWFDQHHHVFIIAKFLSSASLLPNVWSRGAQATTTQLSLIPAPPWPDISSGPPWSLIWWSYQSLWSTICSV